MFKSTSRSYYGWCNENMLSPLCNPRNIWLDLNKRMTPEHKKVISVYIHFKYLRETAMGVSCFRKCLIISYIFSGAIEKLHTLDSICDGNYWHKDKNNRNATRIAMLMCMYPLWGSVREWVWKRLHPISTIKCEMLYEQQSLCGVRHRDGRQD